MTRIVKHDIISKIKKARDLLMINLDDKNVLDIPLIHLKV